MFVTIPTDILVAIATFLADSGYTLGKGLRQIIVDCATKMYPRTDGKAWKYPKRYELLSVFYPAFKAAEKPVVTPKATAAPAKSRKAATVPQNVTLTPAQQRAAYARSCKAAKAANKAIAVATAASAPVNTPFSDLTPEILAALQVLGSYLNAHKSSK